MTQLFAIKAGKGIALAADTKTMVGPRGGPFKPGCPEEKLMIIQGQYAAMTYGNGPSDHVPTAIRKLTAAKNIRDMAQGLLDRFACYNPRPEMGILVAGFDGDQAKLLDVNVKLGHITELVEPVVCRGCISNPSDVPGWREIDASQITLDEALAEAERLIEETAKVCTTVGPPVDTAVATSAGVEFKMKRSTPKS